MPKEYYCKNFIEGNICGEKDIDKFEIGRYSICKKCRNKSIVDKTNQRKQLDLIDKVKKIDPKENIQDVVEYIVKYKNFGYGNSILQNIENLMEENHLILETNDNIKNITDNLSKNFLEIDKTMEQITLAFNLMRNKIYEVESEFLEFKKSIDVNLIKTRLKDLENFKRDILDEKFQKENNS
jgi:hypothetical protein